MSMRDWTFGFKPSVCVERLQINSKVGFPDWENLLSCSGGPARYCSGYWGISHLHSLIPPAVHVGERVHSLHHWASLLPGAEMFHFLSWEATLLHLNVDAWRPRELTLNISNLFGYLIKLEGFMSMVQDEWPWFDPTGQVSISWWWTIQMGSYWYGSTHNYLVLQLHLWKS